MNNWPNIISDLFVNLAAGWIGAIIITPNYSKAKKFIKIVLLIVDIFAVILCLWLANYLKTS